MEPGRSLVPCSVLWWFGLYLDRREEPQKGSGSGERCHWVCVLETILGWPQKGLEAVQPLEACLGGGAGAECWGLGRRGGPRRTVQVLVGGRGSPCRTGGRGDGEWNCHLRCPPNPEKEEVEPLLQNLGRRCRGRENKADLHCGLELGMCFW